MFIKIIDNIHKLIKTKYFLYFIGKLRYRCYVEKLRVLLADLIIEINVKNLKVSSDQCIYGEN